MKYGKTCAVAGTLVLVAVVTFNVSARRLSPEWFSEPSHKPATASHSTGSHGSPVNAQRSGTWLENASFINENTLNDFQFLQHKFRKSLHLDDHLAKVKEYLLSLYGEQYAEDIYETYKAWLECDMAVAAEFGELSSARSPGEAADILNAIHGFRINFLGEELAERLYATELRRKLYGLKRASLLNNNDLYGREKETLIAELDASHPDMETLSAESYDHYQEKLVLHHRDLNEADSPDERHELIRQIREATLPPETVKKLQAIDDNVRKTQEKDALYLCRKNMILSDTRLSSDEKESRINNLRTEVFGSDGAEAKERMENIEKGYQKIVSEIQR